MSVYTGLQLKTTIKDLDGKEIPFRMTQEEPAQPLTLQRAIRMSLVAGLERDPGEAQQTDEQKFRDYELARDVARLGDNGSLDIDSAAKTRIQKLALKVFGKEVAGYIRDVFEGRENIIGVPLHAVQEAGELKQ